MKLQSPHRVTGIAISRSQSLFPCCVFCDKTRLRVVCPASKGCSSSRAGVLQAPGLQCEVLQIHLPPVLLGPLEVLHTARSRLFSLSCLFYLLSIAHCYLHQYGKSITTAKMGREKRNLPAAVAGGPKERHRRAMKSQYDPNAPVPPGFVAKPALPKSKHHSYFEFVENKEKKKKLEFQVHSNGCSPGFQIHSPISDYYPENPAPRLRVRSHRRSATDDRMQRAVERERCHDFYCFGM